MTQDLYHAINIGKYISDDPESHEIYKKNLGLIHHYSLRI